MMHLRIMLYTYWTPLRVRTCRPTFEVNLGLESSLQYARCTIDHFEWLIYSQMLICSVAYVVVLASQIACYSKRWIPSSSSVIAPNAFTRQQTITQCACQSNRTTKWLIFWTHKRGSN